MALYLLLSSRGRVLYLDRVLQSGMALQGTRKREAIGGMMHTLQVKQALYPTMPRIEFFERTRLSG